MTKQSQKTTRPDSLGLLSLALGMLLIACGYAPIIRRAMGINEAGSFLSVVLLMVAGLMAGLSGMMLLVRADIAEPVEAKANMPSEHRVAALCHLSAMPLWLGIPLGNFVLPYLCWRRTRRRSSYVDRHGIASLNFQLSITLYQLIAVMLFYLVAGLLMYALLIAVHILLTFYATWRAWSGREYTYPMSIRFITPATSGSRPQ